MRVGYRHGPEAADERKDAMGKTAGGNSWSAPGDDARFMCDDGVVRTWGEMTRDLEADVYPDSEEDYDTLMFCFGARPVA